VSSHIVVVENKKDWKAEYPELTVISAKEYLSNPESYKAKGMRVINLCRHYRYLSTGYYCSLLGEARQHRLLPGVHTLTSLASRSIYSLNISDMDENIQLAIKRLKLSGDQSSFELHVFFGKSDIAELKELGRILFDAFPAPMLRVEFKKQKQWQIGQIKTVAINALNGRLETFFVDSLNAYMGSRWRSPKQRHQARYDLAILYNPDEALPPSDKKALKKFIEAGKKLGMNVELITRKDFGRLAEYDALFIRETTAINNYTYRFAKKAEAEGMVVFDDPVSIVKCCNKVYLTELLSVHRIPTPRTQILRKGDAISLGKSVGFPAVLKIPDGSFSRGMFKANDEAEAEKYAEQLFKESDLILAQEFLYTDFDWRIGVLNNEVLFACRYYMSPQHWQIVHHDDGKAIEGGFDTLSLDEVPNNVLEVAQSAARLIGNGFYGVDLKEKDGKLYVIEVNDNPSLESGVEDVVMGNALYQQIMREFIRRIELRRRTA